jgi:hypothetical protein
MIHVGDDHQVTDIVSSHVHRWGKVGFGESRIIAEGVRFPLEGFGWLAAKILVSIQASRFTCREKMKNTSLMAMILLACSHLPARADEPLTLAQAVQILQQQALSANSSRARLEIQKRLLSPEEQRQVEELEHQLHVRWINWTRSKYPGRWILREVSLKRQGWVTGGGNGNWHGSRGCGLAQPGSFDGWESLSTADSFSGIGNLMRGRYSSRCGGW